MISDMQEQIEHLNRVESKIAPMVMEFLKKTGDGNDFHMEDLQKYISQLVQISPDSPSRILRLLKRKGKIDYEVLNRRQSLYRFNAFRDVRDERTFHEILSELGYGILDEYYADDHWKLFKEEYFLYHPKVCAITGRIDNIELHHITYKRLGSEKYEDVIPLCKEMHELLHKLVKEYKVPFDKAHLVIKEARSVATCLLLV